MSTITWIDDIAAKLSQGVMYAAIPMIGQNFAAGNILRTRQIVWYTLVLSAVSCSAMIGVTLQLRFYGFVLGYSLATFANGLPSMWAFLRWERGNRQTVI